MFCINCGVALKDISKNCPKCDQEVIGHGTSHPATETDQKPIAVLKPVLVLWLVIARYLVVQINMTMVGGAFGGVIIFFHQLYLGAPNVSWQPFFYSALFFFLAVPIVAIFIHKRTYDMTRYVFYPDHIEYYEGFWQVNRKIINYKSITEVDLKKSMVQRIYSLGSVHVLVPNLGGKYSGIIIADIKHPEKVYQFLQKSIRGVAHE